jgi:predicted membrane protein
VRKSMIVGIFFLLFGISILCRVFFGWHIPIFRTFWALVLIYIGVRMLFGGSWNWSNSWKVKDSENVVFDEGDFRFEKDAKNRFSTVFGSSKVDLTHAPNDGGDVHIDTVFGETRVMIDPKQALRIRANAVFGEARMPNDDMVAFGTLNYKSPSSETTPTKLKIHANVVFGSIRFESASEPTPNASASPSKKDDDSED